MLVVAYLSRSGAERPGGHLPSERGVRGARNLDVIEVDGLGAHRERQLVPVARRALVVRRRVPGLGFRV